MRQSMDFLHLQICLCWNGIMNWLRSHSHTHLNVILNTTAINAEELVLNLFVWIYWDLFAIGIYFSDKYEVVGQNLFLYRTSRPTLRTRWQYVIQLWYDELKIAPKSIVQQFQPSQLNIGHFTQVSLFNGFHIST
jgi:hypothetical protein